MDLEAVVQKYLKVRDAKAKLVAEHKQKVAVYDAALEQTEAALLKHFEDNKMESVRTEAGTAYKSLQTFASVADWPTLLEYIRKSNHDLWSLIKKGVSKEAVEAFKEEHGELPPGVNWREELTINVRRS